MLDEEEFLGPHGIRAISRRHLEQPCIFDWGGQEYNVHYLPAESDTGMFGGNSNWRGPVWFPMNLVILRGLAQLHRYYGDELKVECPTGSGNRDEPARRRQRNRHPPGHHVHRGRERTPAGVRRNREVPDRPALARPDPCSTSTSTATTAPASAPATRRAGPAPCAAVPARRPPCTPSRERPPRWPTECSAMRLPPVPPHWLHTRRLRYAPSYVTLKESSDVC